jgi:hypothetical protein
MTRGSPESEVICAAAPVLAAFELLLRSTSIQANATDTHVIASRIH